MLTTSEYDGSKLVVEYYPDADYPVTTRRMYDDDGITPNNYKNGNYQMLHFSGNYSYDMVELSYSAKGSYSGMPEKRDIIFKIMSPGFDNYTVKSGDNFFPEAISEATLRENDPGFYYDEGSDVLWVRMSFEDDSSGIVITNEPNSVQRTCAEASLSYFPILRAIY